MYRQVFLLFLCCLIFCGTALPATFIVTSNADAGPGTLREALTLAAVNGTAQTDYITFNLTDVTAAGRTITLKSQLPYTSSNLVIDASTQPGPDLNLGDARVKIIPDKQQYVIPGDFTGGLILVSVNNVSVYGFDIEGFVNLKNSSNGAYATNAGIYLQNSSNITIGAPGKGNYINNDDYTIYDSENGIADLPNAPPNLKIQSNYFDYGTHDANDGYFGIFLKESNVLFGGDNAAQGNYVLGTLVMNCNNSQINNNFLGMNKDGSPILDRIAIIKGSGKNLTISNNRSTRFEAELHDLDHFNIYGNTDYSTPTSSASQITHIEMIECSNGTIGSDDISKQNIFHGTEDNYGNINSQNSRNIQLLKNSISCTVGVYLIDYDQPNPALIPDIKVLVNNDAEFSGTSNPGSIIYVYEDNTDCPVCNPVVFIKTLTTDAGGNWKMTGNFAGKKMLANALLNQNSSTYTIPRVPFIIDNTVITQPTCGESNGQISISQSKFVFKLEWYNAINNQKVGEGFTIKNLPPGQYYAKASNGNCSSTTDIYVLKNLKPQISDAAIKTGNPSCGKSGFIKGLDITTISANPAVFQWTDSNNTPVGHDAEVTGLAPGSYTLTVTDTKNGCTNTYGPVILKNVPSTLALGQTSPTVQNTTCNQSTGSITNVPVSGGINVKYTWTNQMQAEVGHNKDLTGQPGGIYVLTISDDSQCAPLHTGPITIQEVNGILLDESKVQITPAGCNGNNGSITGITANGATVYNWLNESGAVVGQSADLTAPSGFYTLMVSNGNCTKTTQSYQIGQQTPVTFPAYQAIYEKACFGMQNGTVKIVDDGQPKAYHWVNATTLQDAGTTSTLTGAPGVYKLYLTDVNGCENYYSSYLINEAPNVTVATQGTASPETCGNKNGAVSETTVAGGIPPYTFNWTDADGSSRGNQSSISNLKAGTYTLTIQDSHQCNTILLSFTIDAVSQALSAPSVPDIQLCSSGNAFVMVNNAAATTAYRLYDSESSNTPIAESTGGKFTVTVSGSRSFYITQLNGNCESARTEVKASVGLASVDINNTFTPNGDGINDYWQIKSIENYPNALIQVFTRYGQKIFESRGYSAPFDGTLKGQKLPAGVYYYIINLNSNCNLLSGSLTMVR